jgi:hypothetical protein
LGSAPAGRARRAFEVAAILHRGAGGWIEISRAADQVRHHRSKSGDHLAAGIPRGHLAVLRREDGQMCLPVGRQLSRQAAFERVGLVAEVQLVAVHRVPPIEFERGTTIDGRPEDAQRCFRQLKGRILGPSKGPLGGPHLVDAKRLAMRLERVLLLGAAVADVGAGNDERRAVFDSARGDECRVDRGQVVAVDVLHLPTAGRKASTDVLEEREVRGRRERDAVGVVEHDQPAEAQRPGERRRFAGQAFHHVAVTGQHERVVIHDRVARAD